MPAPPSIVEVLVGADMVPQAWAALAATQTADRMAAVAAEDLWATEGKDLVCQQQQARFSWLHPAHMAVAAEEVHTPHQAAMGL